MEEIVYYYVGKERVISKREIQNVEAQSEKLGRGMVMRLYCDLPSGYVFSEMADEGDDVSPMPIGGEFTPVGMLEECSPFDKVYGVIREGIQKSLRLERMREKRLHMERLQRESGERKEAKESGD